MIRTSPTGIVWLSSKDRTDALKVPSCECVDAKVNFETYDERQRFQKAKLAGNCCAINCLESIDISGGTGYTTNSILLLNGGIPNTTPVFINVNSVDASGGIQSASISSSSGRYKIIPAEPYTASVFAGPMDASGAVITSLTWTLCYPCKAY